MVVDSVAFWCRQTSTPPYLSNRATAEQSVAIFCTVGLQITDILIVQKCRNETDVDILFYVLYLGDLLCAYVLLLFYRFVE